MYQGGVQAWRHKFLEVVGRASKCVKGDSVEPPDPLDLPEIMTVSRGQTCAFCVDHFQFPLPPLRKAKL